jgi:hypothetical protein
MLMHQPNTTSGVPVAVADGSATAQADEVTHLTISPAASQVAWARFPCCLTRTLRKSWRTECCDASRRER